MRLLLILVFGVSCEAQYLGISADHPTGSASISADGLVASFNMETLASDGRLRDFSGQGNHGTFTRSELVEGSFGKARRFSSVEDRVALASNSSLDIKGPLSIAAWVRVRQLGLHQHILACDNRFAYWFTEENSLRFVDSMGNGVMTDWLVAKDRWYSLVGVFQGTEGDALTPTNIHVYVDGQPVEGAIQGAGSIRVFVGGKRVDATVRGAPPPSWGMGKLFPTDACYIGYESH